MTQRLQASAIVVTFPLKEKLRFIYTYIHNCMVRAAILAFVFHIHPKKLSNHTRTFYLDLPMCTTLLKC
jgi:hypothetical protein